MSTLGRQILVEYFDCNPETMNDVVKVEQSMVDAAKEAEATVINSTFHHFSPFGVSGVVVIQESHLAIHTWPEYGYAAVDIFTCGDTVDPWISFKYLEKAFEAKGSAAMEMLRGQEGLLNRTDFKPVTLEQKHASAKPKIVTTRNVWFTERTDTVAFSLRHTGDPLFRKKSDYQKVEVFDTYAYGKLLTLDGMIMTTEQDEYVYHEMITHVPLQANPKAKRVLIIGGGDGGAAREALKYDNIEEVVLVEIDDVVVEAAREFFPHISSSFGHPRLTLKIEDGIKYVKEAADASFDLVIVDSTDPIGPSEGLFTEKFYRDVYRILRQDGILITQSESPRYNVNVFKDIYSTYRGIFGQDKVFCYLAHIPTYPTGMWSFSFSVKGDLNPRNFNVEASKAFSEKHNLRYYTEEMHQAAFALPRFVKELLEGK